MKPFIKTSFVVAVLYVSFFNASAQKANKYEYGTVSYTGLGGSAYVLSKSLNTEIKVEKGKLTSGETATFDTTPVNNLLSELSEQGWLVYDITVSAGTSYFYVKREK